MTKGWPAERRAAQAARIREQRPWFRSTGPRTADGKARSRRNAAGRGCRQRCEAKLAEVEAVLREMEAAREAMMEEQSGEQGDGGAGRAGRGSRKRRRLAAARSGGLPEVAPYMVPVAVDLDGDQPPGSPLDAMFEEGDLLARFQTRAIKAAFVWQLTQAMRDRKLSRRGLATLMRTSRP